MRDIKRGNGTPEGRNIMKTGDACNRSVICIDAEASVQETARLMREEHVGDLLITLERVRVCK